MRWFVDFKIHLVKIYQIYILCKVRIIGKTGDAKKLINKEDVFKMDYVNQAVYQLRMKLVFIQVINVSL